MQQKSRSRRVACSCSENMDITLPPIHINLKTVHSNQFSKHDNRHAFQYSGVYFGQGLGKRLVRDSRNQHSSENYLSWSDPITKCSTYKAGYCTAQVHRQQHSSEGRMHSTLRADGALLKKFHATTKPNFRHFPRNHPIPTSPSKTQLTTTATKWFSDKTDGPHTTPLSVLAATQQPFLKHNPWAYAFKT